MAASYPGERLGLPEHGPGSGAPQSRKLAGVLLDLVAAALIGGIAVLFDRHVSSQARGWAGTAAFCVEVLVLTAFTGQSIGMRLVGTRMIWRDGGLPPPRWAALRLLLFVLPIPGVLALLMDQDLRGLHDRAAGTVVVIA